MGIDYTNIKRKKHLIIYFTIIIVASFVWIHYNNSFTKFQPIVMINDHYNKIEVNNDFYKNLKIVLRYHGIRYKADSVGKIWVQQKVANDEELIFNFTKKTLDTSWMTFHEPK